MTVMNEGSVSRQLTLQRQMIATPTAGLIGGSTLPGLSATSSRAGKILRVNISLKSKLALVPGAIANAATAIVDALRRNSITEVTRRGRRLVVKRRHAYGSRLAALANLYFRTANVPIRFLSSVENWRRWEVSCFKMLNGDRFRAVGWGPHTIYEDKLPGESIWEHMKRGTLTASMLVAAAKEFRRAHQLWSDEFGSLWSHGDASATNVIYDRRTDCARLIDFEIVHGRSLPARSRHADDLLVFLLDIVGNVPDRQWLPFALCFLNNYGDPHVIRQLEKHLKIPSGLSWIWWAVRTNLTAPAKVERRLQTLRREINRIYQVAPAIRAPSSVVVHATQTRSCRRRAGGYYQLVRVLSLLFSRKQLRARSRRPALRQKLQDQAEKRFGKGHYAISAKPQSLRSWRRSRTREDECSQLSRHGLPDYFKRSPCGPVTSRNE
jgi:hypothetical protein